jgi:hypothetical protein
VWQEKISEPKLRSLEDKIKLQDTGRQFEPRILETRHRRQQHLQNVAERAQRHNQAEVARRKQALEMRRGECLLVKDQLSPFFTCFWGISFILYSCLLQKLVQNVMCARAWSAIWR